MQTDHKLAFWIERGCLPERVAFTTGKAMTFIGLNSGDVQIFAQRIMDALGVLCSNSSNAIYGVVMHLAGARDAGWGVTFGDVLNDRNKSLV